MFQLTNQFNKTITKHISKKKSVSNKYANKLKVTRSNNSNIMNKVTNLKLTKNLKIIKRLPIHDIKAKKYLIYQKSIKAIFE